MADAARSTRSFPNDFAWGAATAGHQIEGNNVNSDYWLLENLQPTFYVERSGDACDSYNRYPEDIGLLAGLGLNTYRFSIEWSRIEPNCGHFSVAELDHYKRVIECCHTYGVAPVVSFNHGSCPVWFAMAGGWLNPDAPSLFARFCGTAAKALADGMRFALTLNEPQLSKVFRSIPGAEAYFTRQDPVARDVHAAAARMTNVERFVTTEYPDLDAMTPQLIAGHQQGFAAIKAERADLPVAVTLSMSDFQPGGEGSPYETVRANAYGEWLAVIKDTGDFTGVQTYRSIRIPGTGADFPALPPMPFTEPGDRLAAIQRPEALRNTVEYTFAETNKPVLVTENGLETNDDARRVWYIDAVLAGLHEAIANGVPVLGYIHWTLLDNFEWSRGYAPKMGLIAVDRADFTRTPKPSARHLGAIAHTNAL
jgi:beta-glucosidase